MPTAYMAPCAIVDCTKYAKQRGVCLTHFRAVTSHHYHHHKHDHINPYQSSTMPPSLSPSTASSSSRGSSQWSPRSYREGLAKVLAERHGQKSVDDADDRGANRMATLKTRLILRERLRQREKGPIRW